MRKSEKWIYVIGVIALVITIIIGTTYSLWSVTKTQENENTIVVGEYANSCIKVTFEEPIVDEIAYPKTDEEGMKTSPLKFTLKNECEFTAEYEIHLEILDTNTMNETSVKAVLDNNTPKLVNEYTSTEAVIENATARILQRDMLETDEEKTYYFRKWIEEDATQSEVTNKTFDTKIAIVASEHKGWDYAYTGEVQEFIVPYSGYYDIELWGAAGGTSFSAVGNGAYTSGNIYLEKGEQLYIYVGGTGTNINSSCSTTTSYTFNGGGPSRSSGTNYCGAKGGGATDVRLTSGAWNNAIGLRSRIMVAGGGGGSPSQSVGVTESLNSSAGGISSYAGGLPGTGTGYNNTQGKGASQTSAGAGGSAYASSGAGSGNNGNFGQGGQGGVNTTNSQGGGGGGGSGYYGGGGGGGMGSGSIGGGGGSSFISGHTGCNAVNESGSHTGQANHYSGKIFSNSVMIDGRGYSWTSSKGSQQQMPNPTAGYYALGRGRTGNGYARITFINK